MMIAPFRIYSIIYEILSFCNRQSFFAVKSQMSAGIGFILARESKLL